MKIAVLAKPKSMKNKVERVAAGQFIIRVKEPPIKGRANKAIINLLADYLRTSPSNLHIVSGLTSKNKIIELR